MRSAGQVSADLPRHVSSWTPAAYEQSKGFHEKEKEKEKEEAEYERRMQVLNRRVRDDIPLSPTEYAAWRRWSGLPPLPSSSAGKRRKRKKRRKRRLPRSPRPLLLGRARRRQRQWYACNACTSRHVPKWRRQAQDAPHPGRYGPEGPLQWHLHGWKCL